MPTVTVTFAPQLQRHVACPAQRLVAATLGEALHAAFRAAPLIQSYVLDEQGNVRKHVAVFVNNQMIANRQNLSMPLAADDAITVIQALSGG
jgi:sulfur carrier protein ThiS